MAKSASKTETPAQNRARSRRLRKGEPGALTVRPKGTVGGGRAIGQTNRLSRQAKENLETAFEKLGGVASLVRWGRANRTEFYKIWARLIPKDVSVSASEGLEDMLTKLAERQSNTDAQPGEYIELHAESAK